VYFRAVVSGNTADERGAVGVVMGMNEDELVKAYQTLTDMESKQKEDIARLTGVLEADTSALNEIVNGVAEMGFKSIGAVEERITELSEEMSTKLEAALTRVEKAGF